MFNISLFTLVLCALALVPMFIIARTFVIEARRRRETTLTLADEWTDREVAYSEAESVSTTGPFAFERTHRHLRATAHCEVDRPLRTNASAYSNDTVAGSLNPNTFEYSIKRHTGALKQKALNMGGFSQVPLLLYDRSGNCFTVHRRLSLN